VRDEYDYVIIGAGSSGCVVANRLSANPGVGVLLVESGPRDTNWLIAMPRGVGKLIGPGDPHSWYYEASRGGNRPPETWQKGRTLGGSSSINGMVYVRGHPLDYDRWEAAGCAGWGWNQIRRVFEAIETVQCGPGPAVGQGPLRVTIPQRGSAFTEAVLKAAAENGMPRVPNNNDAPDGGMGYQPQNIWRGRRQSASKAFLDPVRSRPNLHIVTDSVALRIGFEGSRASHVMLRDSAGVRQVRARREIIVAAGAIQSPKLLQLSGIGPAKLLSALGIAVVQDSPDVGENLREHLTIPNVYQVRAGSLNAQFRGWRLWGNVLRYILLSNGPMTGAVASMCGYVKTWPGLDRPDVQIGVGLQSLAPTPKGLVVLPEPGISLISYFMHPQSRGTVAIRSPDPEAPPAIAANYLDAPADRQAAISIMRLTRRLMAHPAIAPFVVSEIAPGAAVQDDADIQNFVMQFGATGYHVSCTCRMGADGRSVVDPRLRVRGVECLRIADTSIMPELTSGNTNGPAMAIGWRAADMILEDASHL
jgi:choline dehydrogenase